MRLLAGSPRAVATALAVAAVAAPTAHASTVSGTPMSAADVRAMQAQGVREVIVERKAGVSAAEQAELRAQAGVSYVRPGPLPNTEVDQAPAGGLAAAVATLERNSQVQYAEPNAEMEATSVPNDPLFWAQWGLSNTGQSVNGTSGTSGDDIGATSAWTRSTGAGVTVAVVDTGVDSNAPDLAGQTVAGQSFLGGVERPSTADLYGHGTLISGIIAAIRNNGAGISGVAPGAKVLPLQALGANGQGNVADVAAAFNYAGENGVRIVNASLGGGTSQTLEQAIADHPNTLYVVAAGNHGTNNDSTPYYPCDLPEANLICVGASDQTDQRASFSNYGANTVDLFAPGVNIATTMAGGGYGAADGTSMAAPMVSGTLALMLAQNPSLTAAQLKANLLASVTPEPQLHGLSVTGGELNAARAVGAAIPVVTPVSAPAPQAAPAPAPQTAPAGTPAPAPVAQPAPPSQPTAVSLSHVAVRGGANRASLVFTLSAQARVQISVSGHARAGVASATSVGGRRGTNRYALTSMLHVRRLRRGHYTITVRAGGRAVIVQLNVV
jgi:subtilisin family serine protease